MRGPARGYDAGARAAWQDGVPAAPLGRSTRGPCAGRYGRRMTGISLSGDGLLRRHAGPHAPRQSTAMCDDVRRWARDEGFDLDHPAEVERTVRWLAYEVTA